jgi:hypothetical protein
MKPKIPKPINFYKERLFTKTCKFFNHPGECLLFNYGSNTKVMCNYPHVQPYCTEFKEDNLE